MSQAARDIVLSVIGIAVTFALLVLGMIKESGG
jgi:hypothetical protein